MGKKIVKQAKPHRILLQAVVNALTTIFTDNKYADKVIEKTLKENPKFGGRETDVLLLKPRMILYVITVY
jgi:hypothetical protein